MSSGEKIISYLFSIFITLSPLLVIAGFKNSYEFPKFITAVIAAQIIAVLFFLKIKKFKLDTLTKLIFIYLSLIFILNLIGLDFRTSLLGNPWRHQGYLLLISGVIFYLAAKTIKNGRYIEIPIILSGLILSVITVFQVILMHFGFIFPTYNDRPIATMGNPNFLAGYILLTIPFIIFSKFSNKYRFITIFICIVAITLTESRSVIFTSIAIFTVYIYKIIPINFKKQISLIIIGVFLLFISIFLFKIHNTMYSTPTSDYKLNEFQRREYCLFHLPNHEYPSRIFRMFYETHPEVLKRDSLCENRIIIWSEGIKAFIHSPLLGYGQENFELIFSKKLRFTVDNAHNLFLEILVANGIIGLISFLSIIYFGFKNSKLKYKFFLLSFLLISFLNPLFISGIILFWIILGLSNNSSHQKN